MGIPNFMAECPDVEDDRTIAMLVTWLQKLQKIPKDKIKHRLMNRDNKSPSWNDELNLEV